VPILIRGGRVLDGTGAPPVVADVLVEPDEILAVGPRLECESAEVIDASGRTVMPGLIDAHVHCTFGDVASNDELFHHRDVVAASLVAGFDLQKMLRAGVTSVMDPDTIFEIGPGLRDAVDAGVVEGPRIATGVSALLTSVGGTAGRMIPDEGRAGYAQVVQTTDEMVMWTRRHIKAGADWIKVHATGSIPRHQGELLVWREDELRAVCDTAHALDTPVAAHCRSAESTRLAAECGVDLILHASYMDEAALEAVVEHGAALCPTFTFLANLADHGHLVGAGAGAKDVFRGEIEATGEMVRRAFDAGVPLLTGSESGFALTPYGHWHARELELFVEVLGLTPLEAIRCATEQGGIAMRMPGEVGVLQPGARADVLVVLGEPDRDVSVLSDRRNLQHVISRGLPVDLDRPWPVRGPIPGERATAWADAVLTRERAFGTDR
jgi:imidazolonepropionase-like amidohydrolase